MFNGWLFVGCAPFTWHYEAIFPGRDYTTIDQDPRCRRYGATRHVVDKPKNLDRHVAPGSFDLIVCNGSKIFLEHILMHFR